MNTGKWVPLCILILITLGLNLTGARADSHDQFVHVPVIRTPRLPPTEFRAVWVSRFDWTVYGQAATSAKIDEIVENVAGAGFNVIFFQVRGAADAFYDSQLEPWAQRVSGDALGQPPNPYWDPLSYFVQEAHANGLQLHAYINVYPVWSDAGCDEPPSAEVLPKPMYHLLAEAHGHTEDGRLRGLQWDTFGQAHCGGAYLRATPASGFVSDHITSVARDLVMRYDVDGLHLDHIRYGGGATSCDPVSEAAYGASCFSEVDWEGWQRQQVNALVQRLYNEIVPLRSGLWLSAAVWPVHTIKPEWGWTEFYQQGYSTYYQDSKAWVGGGYIHSISPMIYPGGTINCPDDNPYWTQARWQTLVTDFQAERGQGLIVPGIASGYCTFEEIARRIDIARQIGTAGHALFAYGGLLANGYFDDLAAGPYASPAQVPGPPSSVR